MSGANRTAADAHSLQQLRALRKGGRLGHPLDDETARELLKTPPTNAGLATVGGDAESPTNAKGALVSSAFRLDEGPGVNQVSGAGVNSSKGKRGPTVTPAALHGPSAAQLLELLVEENAQFQQQAGTHAKLSREHMQRSLLQLFEDTVRDKFTATQGGHLDSSLRAQGNASIMGSSGNPYSTPTGAAARAAKSFASKGVVSLRPVDQSGVLGVARSTSRGADALTDFVMPDAIRLQLTSDISQVLEHELQRLVQMLLADVNKVAHHVKTMSTRISGVEEDLLHAAAALEAAGENLQATSARAAQLERQLKEREIECEAKDKQMDVLREQITRRNATLDDTRFKFRKEVMRYKAKIYEMELDMEGALGKRKDLQRKIQFDTGAEETENPEEVSAAVETAVAAVTERYEEQLRKVKLEHAKSVKATIVEHAARISERDHEIQSLRSKLRGAAGDRKEDQQHSASSAVPRINSGAATPTVPSLEVR